MLKACKALPDERYQSAKDMKEDLQKYLVAKYYQGDTERYTRLLNETGASTAVLTEKIENPKKEATIEKTTPAAGVLQVLFSTLGRVIRTICWIILFCLAAIGMISLLDANIRPILIEELYSLIENLY